MAESDRNNHIAPEDLSAYADGESLDPHERVRIEQHLETCAACRQELTELSAIQQLLADLPEPEVPRSFRLSPEDVGERDEDHGPAPVPIQPWLLRHQSTFRVAAMAAALLLALVVTIDLLPGRSGGDGDDADMETLDSPQEEAAQQESARDEAAQDGAEEDAAEPGPGAGSDAADGSSSSAGDADMDTADDSAQEDAADGEDDAAPPESADDAASESGAADGEVEEEAPEVAEEEEEAEQAPEVADEEEAAEQEESAPGSDDRAESTAGTEEDAPMADDGSDVASEPAPSGDEGDYSGQALQEAEGDEEGISTLRLVAIVLAVLTILLAAAGFLLPRWWQSASRR